MTTSVTPATSAHREKQGATQSPITVIPTSVICLERWQIDFLETSLSSSERLGRLVDLQVVKGDTGGERFYLDYAQLTRELPESVGLLKEWSCAAVAGCRVNLRHPALISLFVEIYSARATAWRALEYAVVEARAEEVYELLAYLCGEIPCLRQMELSFDAGQPLPARVGHPGRQPRGGVGAVACLAQV